MAWLTLLFLFAATQTPETVPVPPGHRRFGPPLRSDVIPGWDVFPGDVPRLSHCTEINEMVVALNPPQRDEAVQMLATVPFRQISDQRAAHLLGMNVRRGEALATTRLQASIDELREQKRLELEEQRGSWSVADQQLLDELVMKFAAGAHRRYRPYLVRAVSKFGDGGRPSMFGSMCGRTLLLTTLTFSYTIPPTVRVPAVVFLPAPPDRVIASVTVAW